MRSAMSSAVSMSCSIITTVVSRGMAPITPFTLARSSRERPASRRLQPDSREYRARLRIEARRQPAEHAPALARKAEERARNVVLERVAREERDDLVGAREAEMAAPPGRVPRDVVAEKHDAAGVARQVAGEKIEKRGLAGAVRADDQASL